MQSSISYFRTTDTKKVTEVGVTLKGFHLSHLKKAGDKEISRNLQSNQKLSKMRCIRKGSF